VDKNPAYPPAIEQLKDEMSLSLFSPVGDLDSTPLNQIY
jgi:hypothetical protein